jgi:thioredoxin-related protein
LESDQYINQKQIRAKTDKKEIMTTRTASLIIVVGLFVIGLIAFLSTSDGSSGSEPSAAKAITWHRFDEGVALARQENKKILVDVYTDWCGWCKKMDKEVYTNKEVGQTIALHFIAVKLDAESQKGASYGGTRMDEASVASALGATGYPTTVFLDPGAKPITKIAGYMEPKEFVKVLSFIGEDHYKTKSFEEYKSPK